MNLVDTVLRCDGENLMVEIAPSARILIPKAMQAELEQYVNNPVCFGIRPEHISLAHEGETLNTFEGQLSVVENLGNEKYLYFTVGGKELIARVQDQSITTADIGRTFRFNLNTEFCHIFDFYNENNLIHRRPYSA